MKVTFADYPCIDPAVLAQSAGSSAIRDWSWQGLCNSYENRIGIESGEGHILLLKKHLAFINDGESHDLIFEYPAPVGRKVIKDLHVVYYTEVTPGSEEDLDVVCHVRLADKRRLLRQTAFLSATPYRDRFNVPRTPYATNVAGYNSDSLNSGALWTWKEVAQRIWESMPSSLIGSWVISGNNIFFDSPAAITGSPVNLRYDGWCPLDALGDLLARLNKTLVYDESTGLFRIDSCHFSAAYRRIVLNALEAAGGSYLTYKSPENASEYGRIPENVRVLFRCVPQSDQGQGKYTEYQLAIGSSTTTATKYAVGTTQIIYDDMEAIYDGDTIINSADLLIRGQQTANNYWAWASSYNQPEIYEWIGFFPSSEVNFTTHTFFSRAWFGDTGNGARTRCSRFGTDAPGLAKWMREPEDQNFDLVEVVEVTTAAINANGYFAGVTKNLKGSDGTYADSMNCWLKVENTDLETLVTGTRFIARLSGYRDSKPVYVSEMVLNQITDVPLNVVTKVCWDDQNLPLQVMEGSIGGDFTDADWDLVAWDLGITVERRGISFPEGTYFGPRSCIPQIDCCDPGTDPSPPDYPDNQTGNDPTACCSPAPPSTLYATLAHSSGGYVCLDAQVIELTYNTGLQAWQGTSMTGFSCPEHAITPPSSCTMGVAIAMFCNNADWLMSMSIGNPGSCFFKSNQIAASTACSPFSTSFTMALAECGSQPSPNGCEVAAAPTFTVLVTE